MAIKNYTYRRLSGMTCETEDGSDAFFGYVNPKYEPADVHGSLEKCGYSGFSLVDMNGGNPDDELSRFEQSYWRINDIATFVYDPDKGGSFVISIDEDLVDLGRYRCPVCGDTGPFTTFPPTEFDMDETGAMTVPEGMAVDPSFEDTVPCHCKACGFEGHKAAFDTGGWDEFE